MKVRVGVGMGSSPFQNSSGFFRWIDLLEEGGVDSLWQTDRLVSRRPFLESVSTMAAVAGATKRLKFGMNAVVVSTRDPLVLAKQCATIDHLSDGRLLPVFGIGAQHAPEFAATSRPTKGRGRRADELLELMARLWSEQNVTFEGEFFRYRDCTISPRPVQQPLPLWIGGHSRAAIVRTARYGTGWLAGLRTAEQVAPIIRDIKAELVVQGREIDEDHYGAGFPFRFGALDEAAKKQLARSSAVAAAGFDPEKFYAVGDASTIRRRCSEYIAAGVSKFVLMPLAQDEDDMLHQTRRLIDEVVGPVQASSGVSG